MKKVIASLFALSLMLTGCKSNTQMAMMFNVETGDSINVQLDTTENAYKLKADGSHFIVEENDDKVVEGIFLTTDMYSQYEKAIEQTGKILESDGYILYEFDGQAGTERNILLMVPDSETGVIMASLKDEAKVRDVYGKLKFTNEK